MNIKLNLSFLSNSICWSLFQNFIGKNNYNNLTKFTNYIIVGRPRIFSIAVFYSCIQLIMDFPVVIAQISDEALTSQHKRVERLSVAHPIQTIDV